MRSLSKFRTPPHNKTLGIEIECFFSTDVDIRIPIPRKYQFYGFFYATEDGSIGPPGWQYRSVEFVSQPLPADMLCKQIDKLAKRFTPWEVNSSCGIHVHASRKWVSLRRAETIYKWIKTLTEDECIELFGRRPNWHSRTTIDNTTSTRYSAVNSTNDATIEFRMFRSGDAKWAKYCVKMTEYLIVNANHLNYEAALAFHDMHFMSK